MKKSANAIDVESLLSTVCLNGLDILNMVSKKENRLRFHSMFYGNPDGYSYVDYRYDLCADCTEKLLLFLQSSE